MNTTHLLLSIVIVLLLFIIYLMKNYRLMMSIGKKNKPISTPILKALLDKNAGVIKDLNDAIDKNKKYKKLPDNPNSTEFTFKSRGHSAGD